MDPNACLTHLRAWAHDIVNGNIRNEDEDILDTANRIINLDNWIVKGGFLPDDWNHIRKEYSPR